MSSTTNHDAYVTALFRFSNPKEKPEGKLADASLVFAPGPLGGTKLVGLSLWEGRNGYIRVKAPQRKVEGMNGAPPQYYAIVRPVDEGLMGLPTATQHWLIAEYRRQRAMHDETKAPEQTKPARQGATQAASAPIPATAAGSRTN